MKIEVCELCFKSEKPCICKEIECHPMCTVCEGKAYHDKDCPNYIVTNDNKPKNSSKVVAIFPKGTIVKYNEIPCKLLQDTPYYSETFQPK